MKYSRSSATFLMRSLGALLCLALFGVACQSDPELRPGVYGAFSNVSLPNSGGCAEGQTKICGVTLELKNDVVTCYRGTQSCEEGQWSECAEGTVTREPFESIEEKGSNTRRLQALSSPVACDDPADPFFNACDPGCMYFLEDPMDVYGGGLDPSVPLTLPTYDGTCSTDVCTAIDEPLVNGCSPCITTVCASYPSCCAASGEWDSSCVDAAGELCTGVTITPGLCDYGLYADVSVTTANRPAANASIASYGNIIVGTDSNLSARGIFSKGNVTFTSLNGSSVTLPDGIHADGNITSQNSNSSINANLFARGTIDIPAWDLGGSFQARAEGNITGANGTNLPGGARTRASISGVETGTLGPTCTGMASCYTHELVELPLQSGGTAIPTLPTDCSDTTTNSSVSNITLTPGTHGHIQATSSANVILNGEGTYYLNSLAIDSGRLVLNPSHGGAVGWNVNICGAVTFGNNMKVSGGTGLTNDSTGALLDNTLLRMYSATSTNLTWQTNVYFSGVFMLPNARLHKSDVNSPPTIEDVLNGDRAAPVNGAIWARELSLGPGALTFQIDDDACETVVPTGASECSAPGTDGGSQAAITEPCRTGRDCQMDHRCTDVETDASCAHSKCQSGAALVPSCDECVQLVCAQDASCCSTGWTADCVDLVATACDATCGNSVSDDDGTCVANDVGEVDGTCGGYDLTMDIPCDDRVTICNRGAGDFNGNVEVGYWAESDGQMSFETPTVSPDGTCPLSSLTIPAGTCVDGTCAIAASGLHTMMVDPDHDLSECDNRRLDNWTVHDRQTCPIPPLADLVIVEETYEAICPEETTALWSLLGWYTVISGDPSITFSGVVAQTASELATLMGSPSNFTTIGVAAFSPVWADDTRNCGLLDACRGDLTEALSLGTANHGQHLGLRIVLDSGEPIPSLNDWFVTYSCVYDQ